MSQLVELDPVLVKPLRTQDPTPPRVPSAPVFADRLELDPVLVTPLRRPERREQRRKHARIYGVRPGIIKAALTVVMVAAGVAFAGRITAFVMAPVIATVQVGQQCQALEKQIKQQQAINNGLKKDIAYAQTPDGMEQYARHLGYVKEGEVALAVVEKEPAQNTKPGGGNGALIRTASVSDRIRTAVDTCLAVFGGAPTRTH
jgi:cell division protein FtsL